MPHRIAKDAAGLHLKIEYSLPVLNKEEAMNVGSIAGQTINHRMITFLIILAAVGLVVGCGEEKATETDDYAWEVVPGAGCKLHGSDKGPTIVAATDDCIQYAYSEGILSITHINAGFNCCTEIGGDIEIDDNIITITEKEGGEFCHCLCLYDIEYEVEGLPVGGYTVIIEELCLDDDDELFELTIDLSTSPSGTHCIERDHYPWGE